MIIEYSKFFLKINYSGSVPIIIKLSKEDIKPKKIAKYTNWPEKNYQSLTKWNLSAHNFLNRCARTC